MKVKILFFGLIEEALAVSNEEMFIREQTSLAEFTTSLVKKYPILSELNYQIAIDKELAPTKIVLKEGTEIALLPPFAGG